MASRRLVKRALRGQGVAPLVQTSRRFYGAPFYTVGLVVGRGPLGVVLSGGPVSLQAEPSPSHRDQAIAYVEGLAKLLNAGLSPVDAQSLANACDAMAVTHQLASSARAWQDLRTKCLALSTALTALQPPPAEVAL